MKIIESTENNYLQYPGQYQSQPAYIYVDFRNGEISSEVSQDIGPSTPGWIFDGKGTRFSIDSTLTIDSINKMMHDYKDDFQKLMDLEGEERHELENDIQHEIDCNHSDYKTFNVWSIEDWQEDTSVLEMLEDCKDLEQVQINATDLEGEDIFDSTFDFEEFLFEKFENEANKASDITQYLLDFPLWFVRLEGIVKILDEI